MLLPGLSSGVEREERASILNDKEVDHDNDYPDDQEGWIVEEALANVQLVMNLSGSNHVNDLKPDEQIEDECHMATGVSTDVNILTTTIWIGVFVVCVANFHVFHFFIKFITIDFIQSTREYKFAVIKANFLAIFAVVTENFVGFRNHVFTTEEEDKENDHLEDGHPNDVLCHLTRHDEVFFDLWRTFK